MGKLCCLNYICLVHSLVTFFLAFNAISDPIGGAADFGIETHRIYSRLLGIAEVGLGCLELVGGLYLCGTGLAIFNLGAVIFEILMGGFFLHQIFVAKTMETTMAYVGAFLPLAFCLARILSILFCGKCKKSCGGEKKCEEKKKD